MPDVIKKGLFVVPIGEGLFWIGSNYQFNYEDDKPDERQLASLYRFLDNELNCDYYEYSTPWANARIFCLCLILLIVEAAPQRQKEDGQPTHETHIA